MKKNKKRTWLKKTALYLAVTGGVSAIALLSQNTTTHALSGWKDTTPELDAKYGPINGADGYGKATANENFSAVKYASFLEKEHGEHIQTDFSGYSKRFRYDYETYIIELNTAYEQSAILAKEDYTNRDTVPKKTKENMPAGTGYLWYNYTYETLVKYNGKWPDIFDSTPEIDAEFGPLNSAEGAGKGRAQEDFAIKHRQITYGEPRTKERKTDFTGFSKRYIRDYNVEYDRMSDDYKIGEILAKRDYENRATTPRKVEGEDFELNSFYVGLGYRYGYDYLLRVGEAPEETPDTNETEKPVVTDNGWVAEGGQWYLYQNGQKATNWQNVDGKWYFLDQDGKMAGNTWKLINGSWYYFDASGKMAVGWTVVNNHWYYLTASGAMTNNTWELINNKWYSFEASGEMVQNAWKLINGSWYYFANSGEMLVNQWLQLGNNWYYLPASGVMQTGWFMVGGSWYYAKADGAILTSTSEVINGTSYSFDISGRLM